MRNLEIAVLPGDGIGADVMAAAIPIFETLSLPCKLNFGEIGWECWKKGGDPIPPVTWQLIENCDTVLLGAITSKPLREAEDELPLESRGQNKEYISPIIQLRQKLNLFSNVRPACNLKRESRPFKFVIIRENTEGLYAGLDFPTIEPALKKLFVEKRALNPGWQASDLDDATFAVRLQTAVGLRRIFQFAFDYAQKNSFCRVTFADKPNVLRRSGAFARNVLEEVAREYSGLDWDIQNVDAVALRLVTHPEDYGVIVAENMFGDILSDVAAGVMGGLGLAPSANIGPNKTYFEPVHGSSPKYAKKDIVNPSAMFLTIALMLDYFGFKSEAKIIQDAVEFVVAEGEIVTRDLGGTAGTNQMAKEVIKTCLKIKNGEVLRKTNLIAILTTGDEVTSGEIINTNSKTIAENLTDQGIPVGLHLSVGDSEEDILNCLEFLAKCHSDILVVGGLGPTSDDRTRNSIANFVGQPLVFSERAWTEIENRLKSFGLDIHESNKRQALFPKNSKIIKNMNGTAWACSAESKGRRVFMLPGPPKECLPLIEGEVIPQLLLSLSKDIEKTKLMRWRLLGAVEADIASNVDRVLSGSGIQAGYRWHYPYLDVKLRVTSDQLLKNNFENEIGALLGPFLVTRSNKKASELLKETMKLASVRLNIDDLATRGLFESQFFKMSKSEDKVIQLKLSGLDELWQGHEFNGKTHIATSAAFNNKIITDEIFIPFRGPEVLDFAVEYACVQLLKIVEVVNA